MLIRELNAAVAALGETRKTRILDELSELGRAGLSHTAMAEKLNLPLEVIRRLADQRAYEKHKAQVKEAYARRKAMTAEEREQKRQEKDAAAAALAVEAARRKAEKATRNRVTKRLRDTRNSAAARGIEFGLTPEHVDRALRARRCERTGLALEPAGDFAASVDRVNGLRGYTGDNVQVVCWIYNRAKGPSTDAAVLRMAVALVGEQMRQQGLTFDQLKNKVIGFDWD